MITYIEKQIETGDIKADTGFIREKMKRLEKIEEGTRVIMERLEMLFELLQTSIDANRHVPIPGEFYLIFFCLV